MNGKPGTRAEVDALRRAANSALVWADADTANHLETLLAKLTAPFKPRDDGPDMVAIQRFLMAASGGKVIEVEGANEGWWASLSRRCKGRDITPASAAQVGEWLAGQPWADGMTVDRVAAGWPSYLARARNDGRRNAQAPGGTRTDYDPGDVA